MLWLVILISGGILALIAFLSKGGGPRRIPGGLAFGKLVSPEVAQAVYEMGQRLKIDPSFLMVQAFMESRLNPSAHLHKLGVDNTGRAVYRSDTNLNDLQPNVLGGGLFGFIRSTAKSLGYQLEDLIRGGSLLQLQAGEKMYAQMRKSGVLNDWPNLKRVRLATYYPKKAKLADQPNAILWDSQSPDKADRKAYFGNPWTDKNKDGKTTVEEAIGHVEGVLQKGLSPKYFLPDSQRKAA